MVRVINKLQFFQIPSFEATGLVRHGFTTRRGGVGKAPYCSLNTALHVSDREADVLANRALACRALGIDPDSIVAGDQVHGDNISIVAKHEQGRGAKSFAEALPDTDALVTAVPGLPISSYYADCVPIFLLDPVQRVIALAHAGWKGTAAKIGWKTVRKMEKEFGVKATDCLAGIGPSIGPCCYEVDEHTAAFFAGGVFKHEVLTPKVQRDKWLLDLWQANYNTLLEAGLMEKNITVARVCTSCHKDLFFSYRAEKGTTGRMSSLLMLR